MIREVSILIPTYNCCCRQLVESVQQQCADMDFLKYEIVVADDGSSDRSFVQRNEPITRLSNVHYVVREQNIGRSAIRNFLASQAIYEWLLFIDGDLLLRRNTYMSDYLLAEGDVIYGGYQIGQGSSSNLRYVFERAYEKNHLPEERKKNPYHDFHTSNFMVRKSIINRFPFDERFLHYGYEDVLWGKNLQQQHINITHIDNPLSFEVFEDNLAFMEKTEEGLRTLSQFRRELKGYSSLLDFIDRHKGLCLLLKNAYPCVGRTIRNWLIHNKPRLFLFNIYKLLYFLHIQT